MDSTPAIGHRFCPACGLPLVFSARSGREHPFCSGCGFVRYRNPIAGVAVIVRDDEGRVLMGQRDRGEYSGLWCIPCGYVEWDEDIREAGVREFEEETGLEVRLTGLFAVHSNFHNAKQHTVGTWYSGEVVGGRLHPKDGEFRTLGYHDPAEPPPLAFPTDAIVLRDLAAGKSMSFE